jgi:hypothetical protein
MSPLGQRIRWNPQMQVPYFIPFPSQLCHICPAHEASLDLTTPSIIAFKNIDPRGFSDVWTIVSQHNLDTERNHRYRFFP